MIDELIMRKVTNTEFWVGPTHVRLTDGNIINVKAVGTQTYDTAIAQLNILKEFYAEIKKPLKFFIDLNDAGKNSPEARKVWKDISEYDYVSKVALVGIHPVARVIAGFVMSVASSNKIKFFSNQEKALKWIYE